MKHNSKILIIGKRSFLAGFIYIFLKKKKFKVKLKSFEQALTMKISDYTYIINTSINKNYCLNKYKFINDLDLRIAKKILNSNTKYIFFSSRKVYKNKFNKYEKRY